MTKFIELPATKLSLSKRKLIHGVGINDAAYMISSTISGVKAMCPYYEAWRSVINRCYSDKTKSRYPTYTECSICEEWLIFSNFRSWMIKQDWEGKQLDKDLLFAGNKHYSPSTCIFISGKLNSAISGSKSSRGSLPAGVYLSKKSGKYHARCNIEGSSKNLGSFFSAIDAGVAYAEFKSRYIMSLAFEKEGLSDKRIHNALINHSKLLIENN